jgi:hypothetical protein
MKKVTVAILSLSLVMGFVLKSTILWAGECHALEQKWVEEDCGSDTVSCSGKINECSKLADQLFLNVMSGQNGV